MTSAGPADEAERLPMILLDKDYLHFFDGLEAHKLLAQRCGGCNALRHPPGPICPECNSFEWTTVEMPETGTIYSFTIHRHPPLPDYETPHPVGLVAFDNGLRFLAPISGIAVDAIEIGQQVQVRFRRVGKMPSFYFVPA